MEVGTGDRNNDVDDDEETGANSQGVLEEFQSDVAGGERLSRPTRSDDDDHQRGAADGFAAESAPRDATNLTVEHGGTYPGSHAASFDGAVALERCHAQTSTNHSPAKQSCDDENTSRPVASFTRSENSSLERT